MIQFYLLRTTATTYSYKIHRFITIANYSQLITALRGSYYEPEMLFYHLGCTVLIYCKTCYNVVNIYYNVTKLYNNCLNAGSNPSKSLSMFMLPLKLK